MKGPLEITHRLRLQRPDRDGLVEGVAGHNLPVVEDGEAEGLSLRVRPQVRLEAEGVDCRDKGLDRVQGRARHGRVLRHVAPAPREDCVDGGDAVGRSLRNEQPKVSRVNGRLRQEAKRLQLPSCTSEK